MAGVVDVRKLSRLQRSILRRLLHWWAWIHADERRARAYMPFGIPLTKLRPYLQYRDPADRAAFSRALRRLEARGLIIRVNGTSGCPDVGGRMRTSPDQSHRRTDHILLTEACLRWAETVNK
jgi:hypothetical protein